MTEYVDYTLSHLQGIVSLGRAEGWASFDDPQTVQQAFCAPGCTVVVAIEASTVLGFVQIQSDRTMHTHISNIIVSSAARRRGIGQQLIERAFDSTGAEYIDLVSSDGSDEFYRSLAHEEFPGFRLYPR